ncbi:MAG: helicase HerA-like domain-containing protein, partial [Luteibacter sp.]
MPTILIGRNDDAAVELDSRYGNRHGMIAGATGTGKSVSLMLLAEGFSRLGVPCFLADAKGDLAGLAMAAGAPSDKLAARLAKLGLHDWKPQANPVVFWDIYGKAGHPVRATISEMGPTLLSRILELNDTQEGVLEVVFRVADDEGLLLLDLGDLRAMLGFAAERAKDISARYGLISSQSVAAIQRALLKLEQDGADAFFGEPALELPDLMRQDMSGRGVINVLAADTLILKPRLYSTFLLWLLSELFEQLPEVGDLPKPKLVFFFDEAHLLFNDAPKALTDKIEQVVRLIRSKGVGVYFVTQNPRDLPETVLAQLGCRIQHALRAYTPTERKGVKAAAQSFRPNPAIDTEAAITELGTGEALVSSLDAKGAPTIVERTLIRPPSSRLGPATDEERAAVQAQSPVAMKYDTTIDRESAYEILTGREAAAAKAEADLAKAKEEQARQQKAEAEAAKARITQVGYSPYT